MIHVLDKVVNFWQINFLQVEIDHVVCGFQHVDVSSTDSPKGKYIVC
jgi:hypothetical protein